MDGRLPFDLAVGDADGGMAAPAAGIRPGGRLTAILLLAAAALDLTRCGLVVMTARYPAPAAGLVAAGLAAAALSVRTARGCQAGRRWAAWTALLIGAASAPQAAASGFHAPYAIPDTATAAVGVLLAVALLATAPPAAQPGHDPDDPAVTDREPPVDQHRSQARTSPRSARRRPCTLVCDGWSTPPSAPRLRVRRDPDEAKKHARPEIAKPGPG
jgi:hypothetical protein